MIFIRLSPFPCLKCHLPLARLLILIEPGDSPNIEDRWLRSRKAVSAWRS